MKWSWDVLDPGWTRSLVSASRLNHENSELGFALPGPLCPVRWRKLRAWETESTFSVVGAPRDFRFGFFSIPRAKRGKIFSIPLLFLARSARFFFTITIESKVKIINLWTTISSAPIHFTVFLWVYHMKLNWGILKLHELVVYWNQGILKLREFVVYWNQGILKLFELVVCCNLSTVLFTGYTEIRVYWN